MLDDPQEKAEKIILSINNYISKENLEVLKISSPKNYDDLQFLFKMFTDIYLIESTHNLPSVLKNRINSYTKEFNKIISLINNYYTAKNSQNGLSGLTEYDTMIRDTNEFLDFENDLGNKLDNFLDPSNEDELKLFETYSILKNYALDDNKRIKELDRIKDNAENILETIKDNASKQHIINYAEIFHKEAIDNKVLSNYWLIAGITVTMFLVPILFSLTKILPTENDDGYNVTNILIKGLIISVIIYFISLCFRQFNVNKHLYTLNKHRYNALNSYELFANGINDDLVTKNALMIQVAKSIYDTSNNTGYLTAKNQNFNPGIVEMTKIIGKSSS